MVIEYADSPLTGHVEHFQQRVLQDALDDATAAYWLRRAAQLEWAKPRLDDFHGASTSADLSARWRRLDAEVQACRNRARVSELGGESWQDVPTRRAS